MDEKSVGLTPAGMTQSLYTSGLSGEINGSLDRSAVEIRNDSLIIAVYIPHDPTF